MHELRGFSLYIQENFLKYSVCGEREDGMFSRCHQVQKACNFKTQINTENLF